MSIMIIYRETHENITLFHYNDYYHIYLKPMINIILKKNIIYKVIHSKNYEKLFKDHEK